MYNYKLVKQNGELSGVRKLDAQGNSIGTLPIDPANLEYKEYLMWLQGYEILGDGDFVKTSDGNTPLPADE